MNESFEPAVSSAVSSERHSTTQNYPLPVKCEQALSSACWVRLPLEKELEVIERVHQYQHNILRNTKDMNKYTAELLRQIDRKMAGRDILKWEEIANIKLKPKRRMHPEMHIK